MRGGNHGGGTTITRVTLTPAAARELRRRITGDYVTRYRKADADAAASELLEHLAAGRLLLLTDDMAAALPWLEEARAMCVDEAAQRGLDQLIAGLWTVSAAHEAAEEN